MDKFKSNLKLIVQIFFVIIFFSTAHAKKDENFEDGKYISNYFSGILLLNDNYYNQSNKFFKQLNGLEESHITYSSKYIYSLINSQKFNEAFYYAKKLEKKKLANFESDLIQGVYYLKNKNYDLAQKYFLKLKNRKSNIIINNFISNSLLNWSSFNNLDFNSSQNKIKSIDKKFENLKKIQNAFLHCFYKSKKTEFFFKELNSNEKKH